MENLKHSGLIALVALAALSCRPTPASASVRASTGRVGAPAGTLAADTAVTTISWTVPVDGKGPLDSIKVNVTSLSGPGALSKVFSGGTATSHQVRQPVPFGPSTSYDLNIQVCTFRFGLASCISVQNTLDVPAVGPLAVTGLTASTLRVVSP